MSSGFSQIMSFEVRGSLSFRVIPPMRIPSPTHFFRGQWLPAGRREALNGKNIFYKFFNAVSHAPLEVASSPLEGNSPQVGNHAFR